MLLSGLDADAILASAELVSFKAPVPALAPALVLASPR